jgi:hemerythrin-like domain-containing protein
MGAEEGRWAMPTLLDRNIKDLIDRHPAVGEVLARFGIACTTCQLGNCRLRDIVELHALAEADEAALHTAIAAIVQPGEAVVIPRRPSPAAAGHRLSPPLRLLVAEHVHIKQVAAAIPGLTAHPATDWSARTPTLHRVIAFIRGYADRFHHAKEDDLLFRRFDPPPPPIAAMDAEHVAGREYLRAAAAGLDRGDAATVAANLRAWAALITEHIRKEDDLLYPWIDRQLDDAAVGQIHARSLAIGRELADQVAADEAFAASLTTLPTPEEDQP